MTSVQPWRSLTGNSFIGYQYMEEKNHLDYHISGQDMIWQRDQEYMTDQVKNRMYSITVQQGKGITAKCQVSFSTETAERVH